MSTYIFSVMTNNLGRDIWYIQDRTTGEYVFQSKIKQQVIDYLIKLESQN